MSKVTEWFPCDVKPVRAGVYECAWKGDSGKPVGRRGNMPFPFHYFDGRAWHLRAEKTAEQCGPGKPIWDGRLPSYAVFWRGLTTEGGK